MYAIICNNHHRKVNEWTRYVCTFNALSLTTVTLFQTCGVFSLNLSGSLVSRYLLSAFNDRTFFTKNNFSKNLFVLNYNNIKCFYCAKIKTNGVTLGCRICWLYG